MARRGRYGAISGCAWRNRKLQAVSHAARGLLLDLWSFVADNNTGGEVLVGEMRALTRGHKHAGRWRKELIEHGLLHETPEGFHIHDYSDWNRAPTEGGSKAPTEVVTGAGTEVGSAAVAGEQSPTLSHHSLRPKTQDPRPRTTLTSCRGEFVREFGARFEDARGMTWPSASSPQVDRVVSWLGANPSVSVAQLLDGFFADSWAEEKGYPIGALASDAPKYANPPKPKQSPEDREAERNRLMREAAEAADREMGVA